MRLLGATGEKPRKIRDSDLLGMGEDLRIDASAFDQFPDQKAVVDLDGPSALIEGSGGLRSFLFNAVDWGPGNVWNARPLADLNTQHHEGDPAIGIGGRLIVFESNRPSSSGATEQTLWYATRRDTAASFGAPREVRPLRAAEPALWAPPGATSGAVQLYFQQEAAVPETIMSSACQFSL